MRLLVDPTFQVAYLVASIVALYSTSILYKAIVD
jgi:hypothetical protein